MSISTCPLDNIDWDRFMKMKGVDMGKAIKNKEIDCKKTANTATMTTDTCPLDNLERYMKMKEVDVEKALEIENIDGEKIEREKIGPTSKYPKETRKGACRNRLCVNRCTTCGAEASKEADNYVYMSVLIFAVVGLFFWFLGAMMMSVDVTAQLTDLHRHCVRTQGSYSTTCSIFPDVSVKFGDVATVNTLVHPDNVKPSLDDALLNTTGADLNGTGLVSQADHRVNRRDGGPSGPFIELPTWDPQLSLAPIWTNLCGANNPNDGGQCFVVQQSDNNDQFESIYLYDNHCNKIGEADIVQYDQGLSMGSQLPYTLEFPNNGVWSGTARQDLNWWYAGRYWDSYNVVSKYCFNVGNAQNVRPACKYEWRCH